MSLPDTAEYWWDVKSHFHTPNMFRHAKNVKCGHNHNAMDTEYIGDVECRACLKIIKEEQIIMKEGKAPETYYLSNKEKKRYNARKRFNEQHGTCSCGSDWTIRKNKSTNQEFLGCSNYPICKNTKSLT